MQGQVLEKEWLSYLKNTHLHKCAASGGGSTSPSSKAANVVSADRWLKSLLSTINIGKLNWQSVPLAMALSLTGLCVLGAKGADMEEDCLVLSEAQKALNLTQLLEQAKKVFVTLQGLFTHTQARFDTES